jgi:dihydrofolate reductase
MDVGRRCRRRVQRPTNAPVGAAVVGRRSFDLGVGRWGGTPWPGVPTFVITHRTRQDLLGDNGGTFAFDGPAAAVRRAKQAAPDDTDIMVLGGAVTQQLIRAGLLDEVRIHILPLLLGDGLPLFAGEQAELVQEGGSVTGAVTHVRYRVGTP